jgi:hypothetical protein
MTRLARVEFRILELAEGLEDIDDTFPCGRE